MATVKTKVESEDDRPRMTFRIDHDMARKLRRAAKERSMKIPAYLATLVVRGYNGDKSK